MIAGEHADRLVRVARAFDVSGDADAQAGEQIEGDGRRPRGLVVAEAFDLDMAYLDAVERSEALEVLFDGLLPQLAQSSTAILVAYSSRDHESQREQLREALGSLCEQAAASGSMKAGIDLTVNAIELPTQWSDDLVIDRLVQFFRDRWGTFSSGVVVPVEQLEDLSLSSAITNEFI